MQICSSAASLRFLPLAARLFEGGEQVFDFAVVGLEQRDGVHLASSHFGLSMRLDCGKANAVQHRAFQCRGLQICR